MLTEIEEFSTKAIGNRFVKARPINEAPIDHCLRDGFAVQLYFAQYVFRLRSFQYTLLDKKLSELFFSHLSDVTIPDLPMRRLQLTAPTPLALRSGAGASAASTWRAPSPGNVRMPSPRARCRRMKAEVRLLIMWRPSPSMRKISNMPIGPWYAISRPLSQPAGIV